MFDQLVVDNMTDIDAIEGPSILKRKKKIVSVSDQELLLMLRAYQTYPCSWDRIIETVKENIHTLTTDAQDLYKSCNKKQIRTRLSVKEEVAKVKVLETRLTKDHQNVPGPSTANDKRDKILEDLSSEDDNGPLNLEPKKPPKMLLQATKDMLHMLLPYFDFDFLLARTFVASLNLDLFMELDVKHFSTDILLGAIYYFIKSGNNSANESWFYLQQGMFAKVSSQLKDLDCKSKVTTDIVRRAYRIGADVVDQCLAKDFKNILKTKLCISGVETFLCAIHVFENCLTASGMDKKNSNHSDVRMKYEDHIVKRLETSKQVTGTIAKWLMLWNEAFEMKIPDGTVKEGFIRFIQNRLENALNIMAIERCPSFLEVSCLEDGMGENRLVHYGHLLSYVFERNLHPENITNIESFLAETISWPSFPVFVKMYNKYSQALEKECRDHMYEFMVYLKTACQDLYDGNVNVHNLKSICSNRDNFLKIIQEMENLHVGKDIVLQSASLRQMQVVAYEADIAVVQHFIYVCRNCGGNTENLSAIIKKHEDLKNVKLNQICAEARVIATTDETGTVKYVKTLESENPQILDHYCPKVIAWLTEFSYGNHEKMREYTEGDSFTQILNSRGQNLEKDKRKTTDNLEKLQQELKKHYKEEKSDWIDQRIQQFKQYKTICNCLEGAKAIMKVVRAYNLKGNFCQIQDIMKLTGNANTKMKTLDEDLLKTCSVLSEVDRYGPLIFNFNENCDDKAFLEKCKQVWRVLSTDSKLPKKLRGTYENLEWLKSVKKSHGSVEVNSLAQAEAINTSGVYEVGYSGIVTLVKKLLLTDVLKLSVSQEKENDACKEELERNSEERKETFVSKTEEKKKYNYQQLQDLQSRLMLVAGKAEKGNDEVERFTMVNMYILTWYCKLST
ncbi:RNF213 [Mytilus edulis]|uniref:RNF213 n=1 Tax=Mytilus edulis TaxID=6550 RepID=A0A8S3RUD3_MYTED|nr:RNF213 [Mytilus edulis]